MRDRPVESPLGAAEPRVEAPADVLDVVAQRLEALVELRAVRDEVALAVLAEDAALGAAQAAQRQGECAGGNERDDADGGGGDRDHLRGRDLRGEHSSKPYR